MDWPRTIARNIRELRSARGITQEQAASDAGIDVSWWGRIERGTTNPTVSMLDKVATALGASLPDLFVRPMLSPTTNAAVGRAVKRVRESNAR